MLTPITVTSSRKKVQKWLTASGKLAWGFVEPCTFFLPIIQTVGKTKLLLSWLFVLPNSFDWTWVCQPYYACRALFKFWRKKHYCFLCQLHTSPYRVPKNKHLSQPPFPHVIVLELSCLKQYHNKNAFDKLRWKRELFHRGDIDHLLH